MEPFDWELIRSEPTPLSSTLRPPAPRFVRRARPLAPEARLERALLRSEFAWKELPAELRRRPPGELGSLGMRPLLGLLLLSSALAFAQPVPGSWGGYVGGWVNDPPRTPVTGAYRRPPQLTPQQQQSLALQQLAAQQAFFAQQNYVQVQQVAARQQEFAAQQLAAQQELAAWQARQAREQELAHQEQLLAQQQQLAVQQQLLAQQQQRAAADELARLAERSEKVKQVEAEQQALAAREAARLALARSEADAKPKEKGPDIHRWVDEDGVVHYSTRAKH